MGCIRGFFPAPVIFFGRCKCNYFYFLTIRIGLNWTWLSKVILYNTALHILNIYICCKKVFRFSAIMSRHLVKLLIFFSTQMSEIADLTYNVIAFSEIMQMIWKVRRVFWSRYNFALTFHPYYFIWQFWVALKIRT